VGAKKRTIVCGVPLSLQSFLLLPLASTHNHTTTHHPAPHHTLSLTLTPSWGWREWKYIISLTLIDHNFSSVRKRTEERGEEVRRSTHYSNMVSLYSPRTPFYLSKSKILLSDKVTPGTPFYVHPFQKGVHPPVRYPQELLSIYQRVRREYSTSVSQIRSLSIPQELPSVCTKSRREYLSTPMLDVPRDSFLLTKECGGSTSSSLRL
jgi:hypothetical protein